MRIGSTGEMVDLGRRFAGQLRSGDLVILSGEMGAGKTTFVRGVGEYFGVETSSPTFVISRVHGTSPKLVHTDLYRLLDSGDISRQLAELDFDFDADAVNLVEWGEVISDNLDRDFLVVKFSIGETDTERNVEFIGTGARWEKFAI